jgi:hypothetical protein
MGMPTAWKRSRTAFLRRLPCGVVRCDAQPPRVVSLDQVTRVLYIARVATRMVGVDADPTRT